jgi:hypothetical protein
MKPSPVSIVKRGHDHDGRVATGTTATTTSAWLDVSIESCERPGLPKQPR